MKFMQSFMSMIALLCAARAQRPSLFVLSRRPVTWVRQPVTINSCLLAVVVGVFGIASSWQALADAKIEVEKPSFEPDELLHQELLFDVYKDDYLRALTLLENNYTGAHNTGNPFKNQNHLLAVKSCLQLGLYDEAQHILDNLQFTAREIAVQDESLLYGAQLSFQLGRWQDAINHLQKISNKLPHELRDKMLYYWAMSYLQLGQTDKAANVAGKMSDQSLWTAYVYYDLAMAYAKVDVDPSRPLIALRVAAAMTNKSPEGLELSDKIYLAAGYLALKARDFDKATSFLQKVRVKGESAPSAIYAYGMAYSGMSQYRSAVQTWHRAMKYSLVIPGVAESFQATAYGFDKESLPGSAIEAYLDAISVYEKELVQVDGLEQDLKKRGALQVLLEDQPSQSVEWFLLTDVVTNTPKVGFISYLMADEGFFNQAKNLLQLSELKKSVAQGQTKLDVFKKMLEDRQRGFEKRASAGMTQERIASFNRVVSQRNQLVKDYEVADRDRDFVKLAPAQLLDQIERADALDQAIQHNARGADADKAERVKLLKGLLIWQAMSDFDRNRQNAQSKLAELDEQINLYKDNLKRFQDKIQQGPGQYRTQLDRIDQLQNLSATLSRQLDGEIHGEDQALTQAAITLLNQHRQSMSRFKLESQMALVNLFDDLAIVQNTKKAESKTPEGKAGAAAAPATAKGGS